MRVGILYGHLRAGGCERRMGDLCAWLLAHGEEAWIIGASVDDLGRSMLTRTCGVPSERIILMEPGGAFEHFGFRELDRINADIVDIQWHIACPPTFPCHAVATLHGRVPLPPLTLVEGIISVEEHPHQEHYLRDRGLAHYLTVLNWCNLARFPFREQLGGGVCFIGRSFKAINVHRLAEHYQGSIDCFGTVTDQEHVTSLPPNASWLGYEDSAEIMPRYRVVLGSAQVAMEGMASGRFVLAGQTLHDNDTRWSPEGCIITPENVRELAYRACSYSYRAGPGPSPMEVAHQVADVMREDRLGDRLILRDFVQQHHSLEAQCTRIRNFYDEVIAG